MTGKIVDGKALTDDDKNIFHELSSMEALVCAYAGFSAMSWEHPEKAGNLKQDNLNAIGNSFVERATDILWTRIYQHLYSVLKEHFKKHNLLVPDENINAEIQVLVAGMDLWS
jgi:hypothetical protein